MTAPSPTSTDSPASSPPGSENGAASPMPESENTAALAAAGDPASAPAETSGTATNPPADESGYSDTATLPPELQPRDLWVDELHSLTVQELHERLEQLRMRV